MWEESRAYHMIYAKTLLVLVLVLVLSALQFGGEMTKAHNNQKGKQDHRLSARHSVQSVN